MLLAVALALNLLLASCSLAPAQNQSASELAKGASVSWVDAAAVRLVGTVAVSQGTLHLAVTEAAGRSLRASGSGALGGGPFSVVAAGGTTYLRGQRFWQAYYRGHPALEVQARGFEDHWVLATLTDVSDTLYQLLSLGGAIAILDQHPQAFRLGSSREVDGVTATALTYRDDTFWVAEGRSDRLVGFQAATAGSLRDVSVAIAPSGRPLLSAPAPTQIVNPADPGTLPAFYTVVNSQTPLDSCGVESCQVQVTVENQSGTPLGTSTVQATLLDGTTGAPLAGCTAAIPTSIAHGQQGIASCSVGGSAWLTYAQQQVAGSGGYVYAAVTAVISRNPPYLG